VCSSDLGSTVCVLSDGRETEVPRASSTRELVGLAKAAGVRIHAVSLGSEGRPADVSLRATLDRQLVFESMPVSIRVAVDQVGYEGRRATVRVLSRNPEARVLAEKMVTLGDHAGATLEFVPEPRSPGEAPIVVREYRVRVEPLPGESDVENNERRVFVQITGQRIRVMVIENEPSWDTRFVIRALERDPQVELTSVLGLGVLHKNIGGRTVKIPRRLIRRHSAGGYLRAENTDGVLSAESLAEQDVIVLGRGINGLLTEENARAMAARVAETGGNVIFLRVPPAPVDSPVARALEGISPVKWTSDLERGGVVRVSDDAGAIAPLDAFVSTDGGDVMAELPGVRAVTRIDGARSFSTMWLTHEDAGETQAAIAHARVGRGQALAVMTEGLWRWALLPENLGAHDSVYQMFWSRTVRWLALGGDFLPGQAVSLSSSAVFAAPGETVTAIVRTRTADELVGDLQLVHIDPDGKESSVAFAVDEAERSMRLGTVLASGEGVHEFRLDTPHLLPPTQSVRFAVYDDRAELRDTSADQELLRAIASGTGGEVLAIDERDRLADLLELEKVVREEDVKYARLIAWDSPWLFGVIVLLLVGEWIWRRAIA